MKKLFRVKEKMVKGLTAVFIVMTVELFICIPASASGETTTVIGKLSIYLPAMTQISKSGKVKLPEMKVAIELSKNKQVQVFCKRNHTVFINIDTLYQSDLEPEKKRPPKTNAVLLWTVRPGLQYRISGELSDNAIFANVIELLDIVKDPPGGPNTGAFVETVETFPDKK